MASIGWLIGRSDYQDEYTDARENGYVFIQTYIMRILASTFVNYPSFAITPTDQAIMKIANEIYIQYGNAFSSLDSDIANFGCYDRRIFDEAVNEIFKNGVSWFRIIATVLYAGRFAKCVVKNGHADQVSDIISWTAQALNTRCLDYIVCYGGWDYLRNFL